MTFPITGLVLAGAGWDEEAGTLAFSTDHRRALAVGNLCWSQHSADAVEHGLKGSSASTTAVAVPLYLHGSRTELVVTVELPVPQQVPPLVWRQRGVALLAWSSPV